MSNDTRYIVNYGYAVIDPYPIPPLMVITNYPSLPWLFSKSTSRKQSKYLASQVILGQPFNL